MTICVICGLAVAVSGVVAVDIRGRWWFPWRCLRKGRRVRRPYTDLSNPPCLDASHWHPFRSSPGRHRHNRRKSAVWCSRCRVFAVDIRGRRWFPWRCLRKGRRVRRPYTDLSNLPGLRCRVGARCVSLQGVVSIIVTGRQLFRWRCLQPGRRVRRPYTDLSNLPGLRCRVGARCVRLCDQEVGDHRRNSAVRDSPVSGIRGRHSGSMVVPVAVFTQRATSASPLHRFIEPTVPGRFPLVPVSFLSGASSS